MSARNARTFGGGGPLVYAVAAGVVVLTLGPVVYGALGGFRSNEQLARDPAGLPDPWVFSNYERVLTSTDFWGYALNSMAIALITTIVTVLFGVMAAYPLARYQFRFREPLFMVFVLERLARHAVAGVDDLGDRGHRHPGLSSDLLHGDAAVRARALRSGPLPGRHGRLHRLVLSHDRPQPFTAPWSPLTMRRCIARNRIRAGIIAMVVNASTPAVSAECSVE